MKTYVPKEGELTRDWHIIDAKGQVLGRVAAEAAKLLRGKHKAQFTPYLDCGDNVVIVNADKVRVTGNKPQQKMYYRHSGYPGGIKQQNFTALMAKHPTRAVSEAIRGMLPHNRLGRKLLKHVRIYVGPDHPHEAQNPQERSLGGVK